MQDKIPQHIKEKIDKLTGELKKVYELAEQSWEGCQGCDENDKYFWMNGFQKGYYTAKPDHLSDEEIENAWTSYQRECLEKFEKDTAISGYAITNKEKFTKWYREQLKNII